MNDFPTIHVFRRGIRLTWVDSAADFIDDRFGKARLYLGRAALDEARTNPNDPGGAAILVDLYDNTGRIIYTLYGNHKRPPDVERDEHGWVSRMREDRGTACVVDLERIARALAPFGGD